MSIDLLTLRVQEAYPDWSEQTVAAKARRLQQDISRVKNAMPAWRGATPEVREEGGADGRARWTSGVRRAGWLGAPVGACAGRAGSGRKPGGQRGGPCACRTASKARHLHAAAARQEAERHFRAAAQGLVEKGQLKPKSADKLAPWFAM